MASFFLLEVGRPVSFRTHGAEITAHENTRRGDGLNVLSPTDSQRERMAVQCRGSNQ
jgi:hypothetical protein